MKDLLVGEVEAISPGDAFNEGLRRGFMQGVERALCPECGPRLRATAERLDGEEPQVRAAPEEEFRECSLGHVWSEATAG